VPHKPGSGRLTVTIFGGGATGAKLAAELHAAAKVLVSYGFDHVGPQRYMKIVLVEVSADALRMACGLVLPSTITVWATGIKAANFLARPGDKPLATNKLNQLKVNGQ
jgi:NADH dehydrogenase